MNRITFRALLITGLFLVSAGDFALAEYPPIGRLPGERIIRTKTTHFVTAPPVEPQGNEVITSSFNLGPYERFAFYGMDPVFTLIKTASGKYLSATNSGGVVRTERVLHSERYGRTSRMRRYLSSIRRLPDTSPTRF